MLRDLYIYFGNNDIGDKGAMAIAEVLPYVRYMDLHSNKRIGNEGTIAVLAAMPRCTLLPAIGVSFWGNGNVGRPALEVMRAAALSCPHCEYLDPPFSRRIALAHACVHARVRPPRRSTAAVLHM